LVVTAIGLFGRTAPAWFAVGVVLFIAVFFLAGGLLALIWRILKATPTFYVWVLLSGTLVLVNLVLVALSVSVGIIVIGFGTLALASLVGAGIAVLVRGDWSRLTRLKRAITVGGMVLGLMGLIAGGAWLLDAGSPRPTPQRNLVRGSHRWICPTPPNGVSWPKTPSVPLDGYHERES
jgi:hypothetical protein